MDVEKEIFDLIKNLIQEFFIASQKYCLFLSKHKKLKCILRKLTNCTISIIFKKLAWFVELYMEKKHKQNYVYY